MLILLAALLAGVACGGELHGGKAEWCAALECAQGVAGGVCGVRRESRGVRLRWFRDECDLLKYGCSVDTQKAYGLINIEYCEQTLLSDDVQPENITAEIDMTAETKNSSQRYCNITCEPGTGRPVCGARAFAGGAAVVLFDSECAMLKHNCENQVNYTKSPLYLCDDVTENFNSREKIGHLEDEKFSDNFSNANKKETAKTNFNSKDILKNIVVINTPFSGNMNETIDAFFEATHLAKLPISEVSLEEQVANESSRRMLLKTMGPVKVFKPWVTIPKEIHEDKWHQPTLSSCFHRCPEKCPETYAPVCGVPGTIAREPSLMFQNHCFMDMAQCKMYWENKSPTARSSGYVETAVLFCLGDSVNGLLRMLPLVRTLQHMGRLKRRGRFHYHLRNMRFFNDLLTRQPKIMG